MLVLKGENFKIEITSIPLCWALVVFDIPRLEVVNSDFEGLAFGKSITGSKKTCCILISFFLNVSDSIK